VSHSLSALGLDHHKTQRQSPTARAVRSHNMSQQQNNANANIREYVKDARELQEGAMDFDASNTEARLEQTVKELQSRVEEQQAALDKV
jgi:hypothetical protein